MGFTDAIERLLRAPGVPEGADPALDTPGASRLPAGTPAAPRSSASAGSLDLAPANGHDPLAPHPSALPPFVPAPAEGLFGERPATVEASEAAPGAAQPLSDRLPAGAPPASVPSAEADRVSADPPGAAAAPTDEAAPALPATVDVSARNAAPPLVPPVPAWAPADPRVTPLPAPSPREAVLAGEMAPIAGRSGTEATSASEPAPVAGPSTGLDAPPSRAAPTPAGEAHSASGTAVASPVDLPPPAADAHDPPLLAGEGEPGTTPPGRSPVLPPAGLAAEPVPGPAGQGDEAPPALPPRDLGPEAEAPRGADAEPAEGATPDARPASSGRGVVPALPPPLPEFEQLEAAAAIVESLGLGYHLGSAIERIALAELRGTEAGITLREAIWLIERHLELAETDADADTLHTIRGRLARNGEVIAGLQALSSAVDARRRGEPARSAVPGPAGRERVAAPPVAAAPGEAPPSGRAQAPAAAPAAGPSAPAAAVPARERGRWLAAEEDESYSLGRELLLMVVRWGLILVVLVVVILVATLLSR